MFQVFEDAEMEERAAKHGSSSAELAQRSAPSQETPLQLCAFATAS